MRRKDRKGHPVGWTVAVQAATKLEDYYDYTIGYTYRLTPVEGKVAVRLLRNGRPRMTYATLNIEDEEFEDKLTTLKAEAEERAAALEAVDAE